MHRTLWAALITVMALTPAIAQQSPAFAQQSPAPTATPAAPDFSKVEIKTTDLGDGVYMLEGQGGNMTLATAKSGAILVDSQFAPAA